METYVSYYAFFSDITKIIKDVKADFTASGYLGKDFDENYRKFVRKLGSRCSTFATETILGSSKIMSEYVKEIHGTESMAQNSRFDSLLTITERYMRNLS